MYVMYPQVMHVHDKEVKSPVLSIIEIFHDGKNNSDRMVIESAEKMSTQSKARDRVGETSTGSL